MDAWLECSLNEYKSRHLDSKTTLTDTALLTESGLVNFDSMAALRKYMGDILKHYEQEADKYGERIGRLMREKQRTDRGKKALKIAQQNWTKMGFVYVNTRDPVTGTLEVLLEALEDYKAKAARTYEILRTFDNLEDLDIPKGAPLMLFVKNGVPFRIVSGSAESKAPSLDELAIPA
jgi:hypothetical protein